METKFFKKTDTGQYLRLSEHDLYQQMLSGELDDIFFKVGDQFYSWKQEQTKLLDETRRREGER